MHYSSDDIKGMLNMLLEATLFLASDYETQRAKSPLPDDQIPDDIANDWDYIVNISKILHDNGVITDKVLSDIQLVDNNFSEVSLGNRKFDPLIWVAQGLKTHTFWKEQRKLAKAIYNELKDKNFESI